jgi:hypothetical protein
VARNKAIVWDFEMLSMLGNGLVEGKASKRTIAQRNFDRIGISEKRNVAQKDKETSGQ